jgi:hypothetical protein
MRCDNSLVTRGLLEKDPEFGRSAYRKQRARHRVQVLLAANRYRGLGNVFNNRAWALLWGTAMIQRRVPQPQEYQEERGAKYDISNQELLFHRIPVCCSVMSIKFIGRVATLFLCVNL